MTTYGFIECYSGYYYGAVEAEKPEEALAILLTDITGTHDWMVIDPVGTQDGFEVYILPADFDEGSGDGQDWDLIERVSSLGREGVINMVDSCSIEAQYI